jgi:hypothetical protein
MKTMICTALLSLGLMACSNGKTEESAKDQVAMNTVEQTISVIDTYMVLKDALVKTDANTAKTAALQLSTALKTENMDNSLIEAANAIADTDDVKEQRTQFKTVTDGLIASLKTNGSDKGIYVQYCPMAFDNTGANWLSLSEEILNPYFGDMMLRCGKVTEKL